MKRGVNNNPAAGLVSQAGPQRFIVDGYPLPATHIRYRKGERRMRNIQIVLFVFGLLSYIASAFFIGQGVGDTLWRVGVAAMLTDLVSTRL